MANISLNVASNALNCLGLSVLSSLLISAASYHLLDAFSEYPSSMERHLLSTFQSLLVLQKAQERLSGTAAPNNQLVVIIQDKDGRRPTIDFHSSITHVFTTSLFLNTHVSTKQDEGSLSLTLRTLGTHKNEIYAVVVVGEKMALVSAVMAAVCSQAGLKWTRLLHISEWVIVVTNSQSVDNLRRLGNCTDYMTIISSTSAGLAVARKSRGFGFLVSRNVRSSWSVEDLRAAFKDFRSAKKSALEHMHLPVAVLDNSRKSKNVGEVYAARYERFAVALTQVLASTLNFSFSLLVPAENLYGNVNEGLTGLLVRREAAFCTMGMSKTRKRSQVIEFTDTQILYEPLVVTYRLTSNESSIDFSLFGIVQPRFTLLLLGALLLLVAVGLVTHVLTNACTEATPMFSKQRIRTLSSFTDHVCFHVPTKYAGQTGRVLRGSWSVFWLVFSAAISAYFVTNFTVKPTELKIDTLEKLLHARRYSIGVLGSNSALLDTLQTSSEWVQVALWDRISTANKTDPTLLSSEYSDHIYRLLSTDTVYLHHFGVADMPLFVEADYSNVRSYTIDSLNGLASEFLALPKDVFFKDQLNNLITILDETGILRYLGLKYKIYHQRVKKPLALECQCPVGIYRIKLLLYVTLCSLGVCWFCLAVEIFCDKLWRRIARDSDSVEGFLVFT